MNRPHIDREDAEMFGWLGEAVVLVAACAALVAALARDTGWFAVAVTWLGVCVGFWAIRRIERVK